MNPGERIIEVATRYVGLYEKVQNTRWEMPGIESPLGAEFGRLLRATGWQDGWPYCMAFCEAVWRVAYAELRASVELQTQMAHLFTPSVLRTFDNYLGLGQISDLPVPGAVFFLQKGTTPYGHAGIVVKANGNLISTIEGNTSPGSEDPEKDREGDGVFRRLRRFSLGPNSGLWLRGYLHPLILAG